MTNDPLEPIRQDIDILKSAMNQLGDAVIKAEEDRIQDSRELRQILQTLIDEQRFSHKNINKALEDISEQLP